MITKIPTPTEIIQQWQALEGLITKTPMVHFSKDHNQTLAAIGVDLSVKLELLQTGGSFKVRAALGHMQRIAKSAKGVTTASGGNHAVAVALAASKCGLPAKVVVPVTASPMRVQLCEFYGAEVIKVDSIADVFKKSMDIAECEDYAFIHPFDGHDVALGTGGLGHEMLQDAPAMDALIIPIGGGGLISGIANYIKQVKPSVKIFGVEPATANSIARSRAAGKPVTFPEVKSIADSLAAPMACEYSFNLIQQHVDELVTITENEMIEAIQLLQRDFKLAVEPAAASGLAALRGPLAGVIQGFQKPCLLACGTNIDAERYAGYIL